MNRAQRRTHRLLWLVLAPVLVALVAYAVASRVQYPAQPTPEGAAP